MLQLGDQRLHPIDGLDHIGIALLGDLDQHRRLLLNQAIERLLRTESSTSATSDSRTKLPSHTFDHDVAELFRGAHLLVEAERLALPAAVEDADRPERIRIDGGEAHVVRRDPRVGERHRVE